MGQWSRSALTNSALLIVERPLMPVAELAVGLLVLNLCPGPDSSFESLLLPASTSPNQPGPEPGAHPIGAWRPVEAR